MAPANGPGGGSSGPKPPGPPGGQSAILIIPNDASPDDFIVNGPAETEVKYMTQEEYDSQDVEDDEDEDG